LLTSFFPVVLRVDSSEVTKNTLVPGLLVFRVLDEKDSNNRLHHGYQLLYTGDMRLALAGLLTCTVVSKTAVEVVMPACSDGFLLSFNDYKQAVKSKKKMSAAVLRAHTAAANKMVQNKALQTVKILVSFEDTGEELTNAVFSDSSHPLGEVKPKAVVLANDVELSGKQYKTATLYAGFLIARVEQEERMAELTSKTATSNLAEELADDLQGMTVDEDDDDNDEYE
jgi:hypothetical protein